MWIDKPWTELKLGDWLNFSIRGRQLGPIVKIKKGERFTYFYDKHGNSKGFEGDDIAKVYVSPETRNG